MKYNHRNRLYRKWEGTKELKNEDVHRDTREQNDSFFRWAAEKVILSFAFLFALLALIKGVADNLPDSMIVTSEVHGRNLPVYCVQTDEKKVALSFDAAWGNEDTERILEILSKHNVHVTFFMTGGWVESYPDDVKAILAAGHDLGNHSENHKNMSQLSNDEKKQELMTVHDTVKELTGYEMFLFIRAVPAKMAVGEINAAVLIAVIISIIQFIVKIGHYQGK